MHRRSTGTLTRLLSVVSPGVARIDAQREPHADFWDDWNQRAVASTGPLWIALGDSTSQGIGSPDPLQGWVPQVLERLRDDTGDSWRVVNLGITGAQFDDIVEYELPRVEHLRAAGQEPSLMTLLAGSNNLVAPNTWPNALSELETILDALAPRSVIGRVGVDHAGNSVMARSFTRAIEKAAKDGQHELFWPWSWPSRDGIGDDNYHPGAKGYGYMADIIYPCVRAALGLDD